MWKEVWELAKLAGPFGTVLMFYMWYRTDSRHINLQLRYDALLERTLNALNTSSNSFAELKNFVINEMNSSRK